MRLDRPGAFARLGVHIGMLKRTGPDRFRCKSTNRAACLREVGNFKRDPYVATDIVGTPAKPVQNDTNGHPRMSACIDQLTFNGETGTRICTHYVPAGGTRQPNDPDPLLGFDIFFGSNLSLKNPNFRSARCGAACSP